MNLDAGLREFTTAENMGTASRLRLAAATLYNVAFRGKLEEQTLPPLHTFIADKFTCDFRATLGGATLSFKFYTHMSDLKLTGFLNTLCFTTGLYSLNKF
jgi:hypothetical protein